MLPTLLATKLYVPLARSELVSRPRLIKRLDEGLQRKLTLISAPAGFGKTMLLAEWARQCSLPIAWVSVDAADSDVFRLLAYTVAALQTIDASIGEMTAGMLQAPQPPPVEALLTSLINDVTKHTGDLVLVFDDYHLIEGEPAHRALTFLLEHLPPSMHLVIATRADPPLPLAHLRAGGQLTEIRQAELCFTRDETASLLAESADLHLSPREEDALTARTEGWIAGLQMSTLSMQGREDVSGFVRSFVGGNRYILDYLVEEVLLRQPEDIQAFLLQTAILDRLSASLCNAVTGRDDGQTTLETLERSNLFIVPLDEQRQWYRYHRLFADLLGQRLLQTQPDAIPVLHRRASEWSEQHGQMAEAIEHALAAADDERAAYLVESAAEPTLMRSEVATLLRWVEALPDELVRARPSLSIYHAWALLLSGHPREAVRARLPGAEEEIPVDAVVFRALTATLLGDAQQCLQLSRQALKDLPEEKAFLRSMALSGLGMAHVLNGNLEAAVRAFEESSQIGQRIGNVMFAVGAMCSLGGLRREHGQLRQAQAIYQRALDFATDERGRRLPAASRALFGLSDLAREWNNLDTAARLAEESLALCYGQMADLASCLHLAHIKQAQGDVSGANEVMENARQLTTGFEAGRLGDFLVEVSQVRLWIEQGNLDAALDWARQRDLDKDARTGTSTDEQSDTPRAYDIREIEYLILARIYVAQGRPEKALEMIDALLQAAEEQGRKRRVIEMLNLKALALHAQGNTGEALAVIERSLSIAEPEGFIRIFLDEGPQMARLLYLAASRGIAPDYTGHLLAAFPVAKPAADVQSLHGEMVEPLSEREIEVLQLIAAGASNPEIAHKLVISVFTVKKHITNILGKLTVTNRNQAAARARELGLIAPDR